MPLQGQDWGTVAAWAGNLLTGGSLLLGFSILLRDRKKEDRAQAQRVVLETYERDAQRIVDPAVLQLASVGVTVNNLSDSYIYAASVYACPKPRRKLRRQPLYALDWNMRVAQLNYLYELTGNRNEEYVRGGKLLRKLANMMWNDDNRAQPGAAGLPRVGPGEKTLILVKLYFPPSWYELVVEFMDSNGKWWFREVESGKFIKPPRTTFRRRRELKQAFEPIRKSAKQKLIKLN